MHSFTDNAGRTWRVSLNIWTAKQVKARTGVDLLDAGDADGQDGGLFQRFIADPMLLVDVLYVVCQEQADAEGVTDEQFGRAMGGDAIDQATRAFLEALADFTPNPRDRARAKRVIEATWRMVEKAQDVLDARVDGELARAADEIEAALGRPSGSAPDSSESTPAP